MDAHDAFLTLFQDALAPALLIFDSENGPRPSGDYATLALRWADIPPAHLGAMTDEDEQVVSAAHTATAELQAFGAVPYAALQRAALRLQGHALLDRAEALGVAVLAVGRLQDLPVLRDDVRFERRGVLEVTVSYTSRIADPVGRIDRVIINDCIDVELPPARP